MKIVTKQSLAFRDRVLVFSKPEMDALRKASAIARRARELMQAEVGHEDHPYDLFLAEIEHNHKDFEDGEIVLSSEESIVF